MKVRERLERIKTINDIRVHAIENKKLYLVGIGSFIAGFAISSLGKRAPKVIQYGGSNNHVVLIVE